MMKDFDELDQNSRGPRATSGPGQRRFFAPPVRTCFCKDIDYKNPDRLKRFLHENGKLRPRRQTGFCAKCQRKLSREVKRARHLALLPFVGEMLR